MGGPMAANLVKAGHKVVGFDLLAAHLEEAKGNGLETAGSAEEAVADADAVITMLPAGKHVLSVYEDIAPKARKIHFSSIARPLTSIRHAKPMRSHLNMATFPLMPPYQVVQAELRQALSLSWQAAAMALWQSRTNSQTYGR